MADTALCDRVVAVYRDRHQAETAGQAAVTAGGRAESIAFNETQDEKRSIGGEMQEEMEHVIAGPGVAPITKEMTKAMSLTVPLGTVIGLVIGLTAALMPIARWRLFSRLVAYGLIWGLMGSFIGILIGGTIGSKGPSEPVASDRGVVIGITVAQGEASSAVQAAMAAHDPIRADIFDWHDGEVGGYHQVISTDEDPSLSVTAHQLAKKATQGDGEPNGKRVPVATLP